MQPERLAMLVLCIASAAVAVASFKAAYEYRKLAREIERKRK